MLINNYWAVCVGKNYFEFNKTLKPVVYIPNNLFINLKFLKENICKIIINNTNYECYIQPLSYERKDNTLDVFLQNHTISIPNNIYRQLFGFKENPILTLRTDVF